MTPFDFLNYFTTYYFTTWLGNGIADSRKRSLIIVYCLFLFVECYNIVPQHADLCSRAGPQIVGRFNVMSAPLNFSVTAVLAGADPGFLKWGFKCRKGGSFANFHTKSLEIPHDNEIIWVLRGGSNEPLEPPLNPPLA